jgi:cardiolipin synthase A/B
MLDQATQPGAGEVAALLAAGALLLAFRAVFGRRKHRRLAADRRRLRALSQALCPDGGSTLNRVTCLLDRDGAEAHAALVGGIRRARRRIFIGTYILANDAVGRALVRLLAERAREGVEVRVLVDAVGSRFLPWTAVALLRRSGARLERFNPFLSLRGRGSANWRNHRKIAVFDGATAMVGGQNLGGRYLGPTPSRRRFRDASFLVEGPAAAALEHILVADWCQATGTRPEDHRAILAESPAEKGTDRVSVVDSGPDAPGDPLRARLMAELRGATASLDLVTPYFIPDEELLKLLEAACRSGIRVRLVTPRRSDHPVTDLARRPALRRLHAAGAEILLHGPGVLHAKVALVDGRRAMVGSANLDMRSLFLNYEVAAWIEEGGSVGVIRDYVETLSSESRRHDPARAHRLSTAQGRWLERLARLVANQL